MEAPPASSATTWKLARNWNQRWMVVGRWRCHFIQLNVNGVGNGRLVVGLINDLCWDGAVI